MKVCVDSMGGDHAPQWVIEGAFQAAVGGTSVILVGDEKIIKKTAKKLGGLPSNVEICHASEVIGMGDAPSIAVRRKKNSSIHVGFRLVKEKKAAAFVSAGNSGAVMAAAILILRRIPGIERPAIATLIPTFKGRMVLLDIGANVDCRPVHLRQFAVVGTVFSQNVLHIPFPRVGILSNGEEASKGNIQTREAHRLLSGSFLNYTGYIEGRDIFSGDVDVVVCDGFVGNVVLKLTEAVARMIGDWLKTMFKANPLRILGALLSKGVFKEMKSHADPSSYGGASLLGANGVVIIGHGSSNALATYNGIRVAAGAINHDVNHLIEAQLKSINSKT